MEGADALDSAFSGLQPKEKTIYFESNPCNC